MAAPDAWEPLFCLCPILLVLRGESLSLNRAAALICLVGLPVSVCLAQSATQSFPVAPTTVFGYADFSQQAKWDAAFMAVPDAKLAGAHLKELTKAPHWASSPEDYATAEYVAGKFKAAGLETEIVPYKVLLNKPVKIEIEAFDAAGRRS